MMRVLLREIQKLRPVGACSSFLLLVLGIGTGSSAAESLFDPPVFFPTGYEPLCIVAGDLNGDQILDLVTADYSAQNVAVLLGAGDGSFGLPTFYEVGGRPSAVAVGEFNGDHILDLAVPRGGMTGRVAILLGVGDGTFAPRITYLVGSGPSSVAIADLNGDRVADLAVTDEVSSDVAILLGVGDGTFGPASFYASGSLPMDVAIGDLNGDQIPDLVTAAMNADRVGVLLGLGDGTFGPPSFYLAGDQPWSVALGDFDGNLSLDIVVGNPGYDGVDNIAILLNQGDGTYGSASVYWVGNGPFDVTVADFYSAGILDLVVANQYWDDVAVLVGSGNGTFGQPTYFYAGDGAASVAVADYNGDQVPDLAVADMEADCVAILLRNSDPAGVDGSPRAPLFSRLSSVSPNPASSRATISFDLRVPARAQLRILDVNGRVVDCLLDQDCPAGGQRVVWNLSQGLAVRIPVGTYFLTLDVGDRKSVQRITVVR